MPTPSRIPCSTYRLQFTAGFGFAEARAIVPYLHRLGITDVYCSPLLRAAPGSSHGYDVADPSMLDPRLGTREAFDAFSAEVQQHDMGLVLDIVPNHMAASPDNPWWHDVLRHGASSTRADHFDISWSSNAGRLLLPVLASPLADALAHGDVVVSERELVVGGGLRLPLAPGTDMQAPIARIIDTQHYELACWRDQATRLNYRRFFDISALAGVQVELPHVFDAMHAFVFELVADGHVTGLRIDHVDGLRDPRAYLERLQAGLQEATGSTQPFWVVVEKILGPDEQLPDDWPVAGTTGYEFIDACDGLFVDPAGARRLLALYGDATGVDDSFEEVVARQKRRVMHELFGGELASLTRRMRMVAGETVEADAIRAALIALTAALPVYRTYIDDHHVPAASRRQIEHAAEAAQAGGEADAAVVDLVADILLRDVESALRWQQFTGPVMAKSVEDTSFYRYYALPARNEVGAHPERPASSRRDFHLQNAERADQWPRSLTSTTTHDTKRSGDVRARMLAVTECVDHWHACSHAWLDLCEPRARNDAWMIAMTLAAAWPIEAERLREYVLKAAREAKLYTSWTEPDAEYETTVIGFGELLRATGLVEPLAWELAPRGERIMLAATALRMFAPGVPDVYQGTELERLVLVDPDNRSPVDHGHAARLLDTAAAPPKLRLTAAALRTRRANPDLFARGDYIPLAASAGTVAYARRLGDAWAIAASLVRPPSGLSSPSRITLPADAPREWLDAVAGGRVDAGDHLAGPAADHPALLLTAVASA